MNKIKLIIEREYLSRVKKKSFIYMTLLGPILMAAIMIVPIWLSSVKEETLNVKVIDETGIFINRLEENKNISFKYSLETSETARANFYKDAGVNAILYIPKTATYAPNGIFLYYKKEPGLLTKTYIEKQIQKEMERNKLMANGIDEKLISSIKSNISIASVEVEEDGTQKESNAGVSMVVGYVCGFLIYMFIFLYGVQVMRGVIEEKTNRIIEVIISSVKPFQLMMGKIIGIALVGLTQFLLWVVLTFSITTFVSGSVFKNKYSVENLQSALKENGNDMSAKQKSTVADMSNVLAAVNSINFVLLITCFGFYFIGGYLLYSAMFAAVGAAVDSEADTQQFMLPVSIPLILGIVMTQFVINNPTGPIAFWFSVIPFTSPIVMMARLPFGVPAWELILSMLMLILGFLGTTWFAGKIYRTGILLYGKKVNYKEILKWLRY